MRNLFLILMLVTGFGVNAQGPIRNTAHLVTSSWPISDNFESYPEGSLDGAGDWMVIEGGLNVVDVSGNNIINGTSGSVRNAAYYDVAISDDQSSEIEIEVAATVAGGVIVRASASAATYYYWYATTSTSYLRRRVAGSDTDLDVNGSGVSSDDVMRLEVKGDTLSCYINERSFRTYETLGS